MTTNYTATNGDTIETRPDGHLVVKDSHHTEWLSPLTVNTLREYLQHRRDAELGRWRDPEAPDMVVYRVPENDDEDGRAVRVMDESTGAYAPLWERDVKHFERGSMRATAARYFAANPLPRPWDDAKPGEVWVLETELHPEPRAFKVSSREGYATSNFTQVYNGQPLYEFKDGAITAGLRIWPEETDDEC